MQRKAEVVRDTSETQIRVAINIDGTGQQKLDTGVPFLDHMLDQIARHGLIDLDISAKGDLHIDAHHTVEDVGITLGQAFAKAMALLDMFGYTDKNGDGWREMPDGSPLLLRKSTQPDQQSPSIAQRPPASSA